MNYFLGLCDKIGGKDHPLTGLNLVQWSAIETTIECFKGCHLETLLVTIVVREFGQWQTLIPTVLVVYHTCSEHILKDLIHSLGLTIGLWVMC
jgi:hypothetical protein